MYRRGSASKPLSRVRITRSVRSGPSSRALPTSRGADSELRKASGGAGSAKMLPRTARGRLHDLASSRPISTGSWGPTTLPGTARDKSCCSGLASPKRRDPSLARASGDSFRGVHGDNHTPDGVCQCPHRISLTAKPRSTSRHPTAKVES